VKVLYLFPPDYAAINRAFKVRGKPVIFCYGDTIYNPGRIKVPERLIAHESVHSRHQQGMGGPEVWWQRYIDDPQFRLIEEIPAHRAEYRVAPEFLDDIARRLASPLYGSLVDFEKARQIIIGEIPDHGGRCPRNSAAAAI
jgi:hypothetical protein